MPPGPMTSGWCRQGAQLRVAVAVARTAFAYTPSVRCLRTRGTVDLGQVHKRARPFYERIERPPTVVSVDTEVQRRSGCASPQVCTLGPPRSAAVAATTACDPFLRPSQGRRRLRPPQYSPASRGRRRAAAPPARSRRFLASSASGSAGLCRPPSAVQEQHGRRGAEPRVGARGCERPAGWETASQRSPTTIRRSSTRGPAAARGPQDQHPATP